MNYLELVNKILIEMNYRTVINFDELVKQDHLKIKQMCKFQYSHELKSEY